MGNLNLVWVGGYVNWNGFNGELSLGYTPRLVGKELPTVYFHTLGVKATAKVRVFKREESVWNVGLWFSAVELVGVWPAFVWYNGGWPILLGGVTFSLRWDFGWVPAWIRPLETEFTGGYVSQGELYPLIGFAFPLLGVKRRGM